MQSLIHEPFARATAGARGERSARVQRVPARPEPPPGRARSALAHVLAAVAGRVDHETAVRALA